MYWNFDDFFFFMHLNIIVTVFHKEGEDHPDAAREADKQMTYSKTKFSFEFETKISHFSTVTSLWFCSSCNWYIVLST